MSKKLAGTIAIIGVEWFLMSTGQRYKIHISERNRVDPECDIEPGARATAEIAVDIAPPRNAIGWVKNGTLEILEGDRA